METEQKAKFVSPMQRLGFFIGLYLKKMSMYYVQFNIWFKTLLQPLHYLILKKTLFVYASMDSFEVK